MLSLAEAASLLCRFRAGTEDAADLIADPVLMIDGGSEGDPAALGVPPGFPAVVVLARACAVPLPPSGGPDVALTLTAEPTPPWVTVPDLDQALTDLEESIRTSPGAARVLVEVLRSGSGRSVEEGLVLESLAYSMLQNGPEFARWRARRPVPPAREEPDEAVTVRWRGETLELTLNRPHVHNAYSARMRDELYEALAVAATDGGSRVLLAGAGPSFCSGGDLDEFGTSPDPVTGHLVRTGRSPARLISMVADRTEARLHGSCAGSGIELPAFAGVVRARPGTRIWLPELAMGLIPGAGGTVSLSRRIGASRTAWMALSGRVVDEVTALRWGLVDSISGEGE